MAQTIQAIELWPIRVSHQTCWSFVRLVSSEGLVGLGEATLNGREDAMAAALRAIAPQFLGRRTDNHDASGLLGADSALPLAAIVSAIAQAQADLAAQANGLRLCDLFGAAKRSDIPLYANINRRTRDRSPEGFAASARDALAQKFAAIKIAPFDEVTAESLQGGLRVLDAGLSRIAAVREALDPEIELLVDCHWRLNDSASEAAIKAAESLGVGWIECPIPETIANIPQIKRLRGLANDRGMRLAGLETSVTWSAFAPFVEAGAYDVVMPDIKYVGGPMEMLRVAARLAKSGVAFSPHNPSGPIAHAATLHASAVTENFDRLEIQFDETPFFGSLVGHPDQPSRDDLSRLPQSAGLGVAIAPETLARFGKCLFNSAGTTVQ
jgi:galactonate dehydratase